MKNNATQLTLGVQPISAKLFVRKLVGGFKNDLLYQNIPEEQITESFLKKVCKNLSMYALGYVVTFRTDKYTTEVPMDQAIALGCIAPCEDGGYQWAIQFMGYDGESQSVFTSNS